MTMVTSQIVVGLIKVMLWYSRSWNDNCQCFWCWCPTCVAQTFCFEKSNLSS